MKIILIVLDSVGVGALPDAAKYNDSGANTLGHIASSIKDFDLPNMAKLGLYQLISGLEASATRISLIGSYGKMAEASVGKDTPTGHWEITGIIMKEPLPTYPQGFPKDLIEKFEKAIGTKTLGNYPCSGTEIIKRLGAEHYKTGYPIVYTSADSVFQIAAHEDEKIFGLKRLYEISEIARKMLVYPHNVGRVIARPFIGTPPNFQRTTNRRDYSLEPPAETLLDKIEKSGGEVIAVGKIDDIFSRRGITRSFHCESNQEALEYLLKILPEKEKNPRTLILVNLVDFDMLWGHRRNVSGYYQALKDFDGYLGRLEEIMAEEDILFLTADHGCDPTHQLHTDHTREYVPVLVYGQRLKAGQGLGVRQTFADLGQTIAEIFQTEKLPNGVSFLNEIADRVSLV